MIGGFHSPAFPGPVAVLTTHAATPEHKSQRTLLVPLRGTGSCSIVVHHAKRSTHADEETGFDPADCVSPVAGTCRTCSTTTGRLLLTHAATGSHGSGWRTPCTGHCSAGGPPGLIPVVAGGCSGVLRFNSHRLPSTVGQAWNPAAQHQRLLSTGAIAMLTPWPAAGSALAFFELFFGPTNSALSGYFLFGILDPADELVPGQRRDVHPGVEGRGIGDECLP
jgi:hypothetical protein